MEASVASVLNGIARSVAPGGLKKALSFRVVELALRDGEASRWDPAADCRAGCRSGQDLVPGYISRHSRVSPQERTSDKKFEVHKIVLPERILEKDCAQIGVPRERVQQRSAEKEILADLWRIFQEHISDRTQIVEVPMPQIAKETVEAVRVVQRERVQQRTAEQTEDLPQSPAEVVDAVTPVPGGSEVVAGGMSERHWLVTLGVCFRRWTWTNTTIAMARTRRKLG